MESKTFSYKSANIKIFSDTEELIKIGYDEFIFQYNVIEEYTKKNKQFLEAIKPVNIVEEISHVPEIIKKMCEGSKKMGVGPMASVAGTIAEFSVRKMIDLGAKNAIVENGGDMYIVVNDNIKVGLFAGKNKIGQNLAVEILSKKTPIAICSSSSFMGHSASFGKCDLATVFSKDASIADSCATECANRVKTKSDIEKVLEWAISNKDVDGVIIVKDGNLGMIGNVPKIVKNVDLELKRKISSDSFFDVLLEK